MSVSIATSCCGWTPNTVILLALLAYPPRHRCLSETPTPLKKGPLPYMTSLQFPSGICSLDRSSFLGGRSAEELVFDCKAVQTQRQPADQPTKCTASQRPASTEYSSGRRHQNALPSATNQHLGLYHMVTRNPIAAIRHREVGGPVHGCNPPSRPPIASGNSSGKRGTRPELVGASYTTVLLYCKAQFCSTTSPY